MALSTPNRHAASHGLEPAAHVIVRAAAGTAERRLFARALLRRKRLRFATVADREAAPDHLLAAVMHVASEQDQMDQELGATSGGDSITEFVQRSRLFRTRGLSLDTSLRSHL